MWNHLVMVIGSVGLVILSQSSFGQGDATAMAGLDVEAIQEFDSLDRDRSRGIGPEEFTSSEVGKSARAAGNDKKVAAVFKAIDENGDGEIDFLELIKSQHNRNTRLLDGDSARRFHQMDTDHDGLVSLDEYLERPKADKAIFESIDLNGSGKVGPFEWVQGIRDQFMSSALAMKFAGLDEDDSGFVDQFEFEILDIDHALSGEFSAVDLNGNSVISPKEFGKALSGKDRGDSGASSEIIASFETLDRNKDNALSRREFARSDWVLPNAPDQMADMMFARADRNGDDELSLSEFAKIRKRPGMKPGKSKGPGKKKGGPGKGKPGR